jgi:hypothetical protein
LRTKSFIISCILALLVFIIGIGINALINPIPSLPPKPVKMIEVKVLESYMSPRTSYGLQISGWDSNSVKMYIHSSTEILTVEYQSQNHTVRIHHSTISVIIFHTWHSTYNNGDMITIEEDRLEPSNK